MTLRPVLEDDGESFAVRNGYPILERLKAIPGAHFERPTKRWLFPRSPLTARSLLAIFPAAPDSVHELADFAAIERREDPGLIEPLPFDSPFGDRWRHQLRASRWLQARKSALLQYGLGTGKTRAALDAVRVVEARKAVVLCPLRVCAVWEREANRHHPDVFRVVRLDSGSLARRRRIFDQAMERAANDPRPVVFALNYESAWRPAIADALVDLRPDVLILDECHRIKGPGATQSRYAARLARASHRTWGLSGTPLAHSPLDAYGIFRAIDPGVFGTSFKRFRDSYCEMGGFGGHQVLGYRNVEDFRRRYFALTLAESRDVLDLPEAIHETVDVELPPEAKRIHDQIKEEAVAVLGSDGSREVVAQNVLVRFLRMAQVASGHVAVDVLDDPDVPDQRSIDEVHRAKEAALQDILEDLDPSEPVVVFCRFKHDVLQIRRATEAAGRKVFEVSGSRNDLEFWQETRGGNVLAANIQSGGEGIDLTRARYAVYYDLPFSLSQYQQSLARIHRPGQTRTVAYYYLVARGTIDNYVRRTLDRRQNVIDRVLDERALDFENQR